MILENEDRGDISSVAGEEMGSIDFYATDFIKDYSPIIETDYIQKIKNILDTNDAVTYLVIEGLSNLANFLKQYPEYADTFDIVHMGLTTKDATEFTGGGTNIEADPLATKYVYELQLRRMRVVGGHTTTNDAIRVHPATGIYKKLEASSSKNHQILFRHLQEYYFRKNRWPALHDPLAASVVLGRKFVDFTDVFVEFNESGQYKIGGNTKVIVSKDEVKQPEAFMRMMAEAI